MRWQIVAEAAGRTHAVTVPDANSAQVARALAVLSLWTLGTVVEVLRVQPSEHARIG